MTKYQFLAELESRLSGLPKDDIKERLSFFDEMIDDLVDEGLSEEQAVEHIGSVDDVVWQILEDTPITKLVKEKIKPKRRLATWEIVLLAIGAPIWLSLIITAIAVVISLYVSAWAVIISLWSVFAAFVGTSFGAMVGGTVLACLGYAMSGLFVISGGIVLAGLSIFAFFGCRAATKGIICLTKKLPLAIKKPFCRKENRQ